MKILKQVGILFGLCWVSMYIEKLLPFTFPSSVIALIILLILLLIRVVKVDHVREKSDFLLGNLPFFFIPATTGIIQYKEIFLRNGTAFLVICVVSMVITFAVTAWAVQLTMRLIDRRNRK
ncbi:CidA/LrgA family protein [Oscillibacter sp.]|uniref:CidA/LrgA family protein n=1 Tax=Oscillibacter sp. TaxID=1945593 RepID=UPI003396981A